MFYSFSDKFGSRWGPLTPLHSSSVDRKAWSSHNATVRGGKDQLQRGSSLHSFGWRATSLSVPSSSFPINESYGHNFHAAAEDVPLAVIVGNLAAAASEISVQSTALRMPLMILKSRFSRHGISSMVA